MLKRLKKMKVFSFILTFMMFLNLFSSNNVSYAVGDHFNYSTEPPKSF